MQTPDGSHGVDVAQWVPAIISLSGSLAAAWIAYRGIVIGLRHNFIREDTARKAEIKRRVIVEAAQAVVSAVEYLGTMPDRFIPDEVSRRMVSGFNSASAQLDMAADIDTVRAFNSFRALFFQITEEFSEDRRKMLFFKSRGDAQLKIVDFVDEASKKFTLENTTLQESFIATLGNARSTALTNYFEADFNAARLALSMYEILEGHGDSLEKSQTEFFLLARKELGFDVSEAGFRKIAEDNAASHSKSNKKLIEKMREALKQQSTKPPDKK